MKITPQMTDAAMLAEIGRRLERLRLDRNVTQERLAREAGISRRTLVRLERGEDAVGATTLLRVLRVLGLVDRVDQLVPELLPSPIEELRSRGRRRQRASGAPRSDAATPWAWDDTEMGDES